MTRYGETFPAWRAAAGDHWHAYTRHAFVEGLRDGSLPRAAFLDYLVQDYIFLIHFSRAWALAVTKADTVDEMRLAAGTVNALINDEMALHIRICAEAGISEDALSEAEEKTQNIAYTRYVLDAGHSGDFLDLLAALAPCVLGYGEIGARLSHEATSDTYADWIATYAGEDYQQVCHDVGGLIDSAIARRLGPAAQDSPRWAHLSARFTTATRLEVGFWDMGFEG
ncbi:thiaminase/transcriptional activator TenA [Roseovarius halotolerans]|uniref:Thiaminase-2 n=1 Tax=Roseovarius halotolerans TaxID=505353 RepID=A0A1X6Y7Z7_9RHOB|nr:TenA family protein [Roseovarius halotolerans]RKT35121.1 thiaminase/transcriptional activator TenA [Roseovarius halotolerans]SLN13485.1 Thiaminase-2 [Roseovarius halotolerans]